MKVADVMTRRVVSVAPDASIRDALVTMLKNKFSGLPVIDTGGDLVGIVTEGDFLRRGETGTEKTRSPWYDAFFGAGEAASAYIRAHGMKVHDVMTRELVTVVEDTPLREAVDLMEQRGIKRLPVLRGAKVVGIVSRANLLRALASLLRTAPRQSKSDDAIRAGILSKLQKQTWSAGVVVEVLVRKGVVDVWGTVDEGRQRDAIKILVESMPGVKRLEDHMSWSAVAPL
jgi:CBS domain-containing protein